MSLKIDMARKFLELIGYLHLLGYQQLRIVPYVRDGPAPFWVCDLAPASDIRRDHGAMSPNLEHGPGFFSVRYVPHSPWPGFVEQSLEQAAMHFLAHYPGLAEKSRGEDAEYAGWYQEMLIATAPHGLVASEVYWESPPDHMYVLHVANAVHVSLPPPGTASQWNGAP